MNRIILVRKRSSAARASGKDAPGPLEARARFGSARRARTPDALMRPDRVLIPPCEKSPWKRPTLASARVSGCHGAKGPAMSASAHGGEKAEAHYSGGSTFFDA